MERKGSSRSQGWIPADHESQKPGRKVWKRHSWNRPGLLAQWPIWRRNMCAAVDLPVTGRIFGRYHGHDSGKKHNRTASEAKGPDQGPPGCPDAGQACQWGQDIIPFQYVAWHTHAHECDYRVYHNSRQSCR